MQLIPSQRIRRPRIIVILCTAIVAAIAGVVVGLQVSHHQTAQTAARPVSCGSTWTHSVSGHMQLLGADHGALTCFDAAVRACKPASLHVIDMGVDTGTDYVFTIEGGANEGGANEGGAASCRVTEASNFYSANGGGSTGPVTTTSCLRTAVTGAGVSLSCAGQDLLIPAKVHPVLG
jgi:hypothetical protein